MNKPKIEIIALSNYADISKEGKLSISGIFDEIHVNTIPSSFVRGFIVFTVSGLSHGKKTNLVMTIRFSSDAKPILVQPVEITPGRNGKGNFIAEVVGMPLPSAGEYLIKVTVDNKEIGGTSFHVLPPLKDEKNKDKSGANQ